MMYIELSGNSSSECFKIFYQQDINTKGVWSSFTVQNLSKIRKYELTHTELLRFIAQSQETYLKLRYLISVLFREENGLLTYQSKSIESYSELTFCEYLQPVAERIKQESLDWFGNSSFQVTSVPDLLEGL